MWKPNEFNWEVDVKRKQPKKEVGYSLFVPYLFCATLLVRYCENWRVCSAIYEHISIWNIFSVFVVRRIWGFFLTPPPKTYIAINLKIHCLCRTSANTHAKWNVCRNTMGEKIIWMKSVGYSFECSECINTAESTDLCRLDHYRKMRFLYERVELRKTKRHTKSIRENWTQLEFSNIKSNPTARIHTRKHFASWPHISFFGRTLFLADIILLYIHMKK